MSKLNARDLQNMNEKDIRDKINEVARSENIRQWDLGASVSQDSSVQVDHGEAKQMKSAQRSSITIRVWNKNGLVGITSTSDMSESGLEKGVIGAHEASKYGNPNEVPDFSPLAKAPLPELNRPIKETTGIQNLFNKLKTAEQDLLNQHNAINTVPYNGISEAIAKRLYLNSEGAHRELIRSQASLYLYARAEEAGRKPRSSGAVRLGLGAEDLDINSCVKEAASRTISHLNYKPIQTKSYLICFMPEAFLELIGAFSNMFNARSVLDGVSLSNKDSLGKNIAVPFLSLNDNGLHPEHIGASSFDGEGTPTRDLCLIKDGTLESFLHSEATAREFGVKPTGHAGLGAKVSVGPDWFVVSKTNEHSSKNNELHHIDCKHEYVLIESLNAIHSGVKQSQGSFSLPFDGWLVQSGEKISIEAATIAGDIRYVLNNILNLEDQPEVNHIGISPYVWVDNLSITGEA